MIDETIDEMTAATVLEKSFVALVQFVLSVSSIVF